MTSQWSQYVKKFAAKRKRVLDWIEEAGKPFECPLPQPKPSAERREQIEREINALKRKRKNFGFGARPGKTWNPNHKDDCRKLDRQLWWLEKELNGEDPLWKPPHMPKEE